MISQLQPQHNSSEALMWTLQPRLTVEIFFWTHVAVVNNK